MVAFIGPNAPTRIQQILRTTAKHFSLDWPEPELQLHHGEFIDPWSLRWMSGPSHDNRARSVERSGAAWQPLGL